MKTCADCGVRKPVTDFGKNRATGDGFSVYCLTCNRRRNRAYYRERREREGHTFREPDTSPEGFKRCSSCRRSLPVADYHAHKTQADSLNTYCKECRSEQNRAVHLRRNYGLEVDDLAAMIDGQGGVCALCKKRRPVHVDHDHVFETVRGVLCFPCNAALGQLQDNIEFFQNGIDYLERTTWQRTLVSTGVYQLTSPHPAAAASPTSSERLRRIFCLPD